MEKILHPATTESTANYGRLQAKYSFSFANCLKSNRMQFGLPDVLNTNKTLGDSYTHWIWNAEIVAITNEEDSRA